MTNLKNKMKPAGKDDKFSVNVVDMQQIFDNEKEKKDKKPKLLISSSTFQHLPIARADVRFRKHLSCVS